MCSQKGTEPFRRISGVREPRNPTVAQRGGEKSENRNASTSKRDVQVSMNERAYAQSPARRPA